MTEILAKGDTVAIEEKSSQPQGSGVFYVGAGWDLTGAGTDLDLCVDLDADNGQTQVDFVFYGKKATQGVQLSEDNRTGAGEGDDEFAVIRVGEVLPQVDEINIAFAVYAGDDFATVQNPHLRICDGDGPSAPEIANYPITGVATEGDTLLHAATLRKGANGWTLEAVGEFKKVGKGTAAIEAAKAL